MKRLASLVGVALLLVAPTCVAQGPVPPVPTPSPSPAPNPLPPAPTPVPGPVVKIEIDGPASVPDRTLATFELVGSEAAVAWLVIPAVSQDVCDQKLNFTGQAGTYTVIAFAITSSNTPVIVQKNVVLEGDDPNPDPPVPPIPPAPPAPTPVTVPLMAYAIFDTNQQTSLPAGQRALFFSESIITSLKALGVTWRHVDVSAPEIQSPSWKQAIASFGLPALLVMDKQGNLFERASGPLPADEATTVAQLKGLRGFVDGVIKWNKKDLGRQRKKAQLH